MAHMKRIVLLFLLIICLLALTVAAENQVQMATVFHAPTSSKAPFAPVPLQDSFPFKEDADLLRVDFINIKVGDAILIRSGGESLLVDGGARGREAMLEQFFQPEGITGFTYYMNTHSHDDHIQAATALVRKGYLAREFLGRHPKELRNEDLMKLVAALDAQAIPYRQVVSGESITLGKAVITFLNDPRDIKGNVNATSMMLHIRLGARSMLLPADVTGSSLSHVAQLYPEYMDVDIMKSPHHGINRLPHEFLLTTSPEAFVITSNTKGGANLATQLTRGKYPHYFISMGTVTCTTDGETWYVEQKKPQ